MTVINTKYFYAHCISRLAAIIVTAEIIAMLIFDLTGWEKVLPALPEALLDSLFLITFSIYPLYLWVYTPIVKRFQTSHQQIEMLAEALQGAGESVVITDPDGAIIYINQAFTDITGYSFEEVLGKNPSILQSGKQDKAFYDRMWRSITTQDKWKGELWNRRKNGDLFPEALDIRAIRHENGDLKFLVGVFSDLTVQKRIENALIQSQKLEAVGTLVGGVAHNFNNLLAAISGKAYLGHRLATKVDAQATFTRHLAEIQQLAFDASNLVKQLLAFSRESRHEKQDLSFNLLIREAVATASIGMPETIRIEISMPDETITVHADPVHLKQAIINLLNNARDAVETAETKQIHIRLARELSNAGCVHQDTCHLHCKDMAILEIEDSGSGINSTDIEKLFEPFFTTKVSGKGTGLGLSTAHGIIISHNGTINVTSTFSKGTTFNICLPLVHGANLQSEEATMTQPAEVRQAATILLVDDNSDVRDTMALILKSLGHNVVLASDGIEALEKFMTCQGCISVVVSDIIMPGMDGIDSILEMRKKQPELPVIFITGYDNPKEVMSVALQNETTILLNKPFKTAELSDAVDKLISRSSQQAISEPQ
ncbi:MAG: hypothetical protein COW18_00945 [Zetaproteobacteria bacterium CG12_big_fil_rev_8_21_14_0_65_54_13]|nr:MAG: hypothetical protein COW18_00945 [Zetaproteobacteria bacterium CG12_big_fil_rev_8_21_14_0_65_54_13]PIX55698.1 MAG: hypothetical protein COZ50_01445 [Zetaproteobacteria bacterium CG_4_10_14_3_um_filter_54_28]PJA29345.1 MAG: hypothetical protein CO188_06790 [Zetaproteobacteria bacterium CG_4_9_14_3_um_filter_54_145]